MRRMELKSMNFPPSDQSPRSSKTEEVGSLRVVSEALEASPVGTKPPAAVDGRISMDGSTT